MFICPNCQHESLDIKTRKNLPPNGDWDEIQLQLAKCDDCMTFAVAEYCEERHGSLDRECWSHDGIIVSQKTWEILNENLSERMKMSWFWERRKSPSLNLKGNIREIIAQVSEDFDPNNVQWFKLKVIEKPIEIEPYVVKRVWKKSKRPWRGFWSGVSDP